MSTVALRQQRVALYLSVCGLLLMVAAVGAVSARDPAGLPLRLGMIAVTVGAGLWLPWQAALPAAFAIWLGTNAAGSFREPEALFGTNMLLELPGLLGIAVFALLLRRALRGLEEQTLLLAAAGGDLGIDSETGVYEARLLRPALEAELVRSRRFGREFALVLVGIDHLRQKFDYRHEAVWRASFQATAQLLCTTRAYDRVFRHEATGFAILLPEAGSKEVLGLVRRLRLMARRRKPAEGEPGGPLPVQFGATFFPQCATTTDDLIRRAEVALRIADKSFDRLQLDSAEAPDLPAPETLRQLDRPPQEALSQSAAPEFVEDAAAEQADAPSQETIGESATPEFGTKAAAEEAGVPGLLEHLEETLKLIRSLRNRAA